jgi:hypothetical protein
VQEAHHPHFIINSSSNITNIIIMVVIIITMVAAAAGEDVAAAEAEVEAVEEEEDSNLVDFSILRADVGLEISAVLLISSKNGIIACGILWSVQCLRRWAFYFVLHIILCVLVSTDSLIYLVPGWLLKQ